MVYSGKVSLSEVEAVQSEGEAYVVVASEKRHCNNLKRLEVCAVSVGWCKRVVGEIVVLST